MKMARSLIPYGKKYRIGALVVFGITYELLELWLGGEWIVQLGMHFVILMICGLGVGVIGDQILQSNWSAIVVPLGLNLIAEGIAIVILAYVLIRPGASELTGVDNASSNQSTTLGGVLWAGGLLFLIILVINSIFVAFPSAVGAFISTLLRAIGRRRTSSSTGPI